MYKVKHNLSESCLKDLFSAVNSNYNVLSQSDFGITGAFFYLKNSMRIFGLGLWNILQTVLRKNFDFDLLKTLIP